MRNPNILIRFLMLCTSIIIAGCTRTTPAQPSLTPVQEPLPTSVSTKTSVRIPSIPDRGFFMGVLPMPAEGQEIGAAYVEASEYSDFVPVWSSGIGSAGFWDYAETLSGWGGETFIDGLIRGNGMFPILHFSFISRDPSTRTLILKTPPEQPEATLSDPLWRETYKNAIIDGLNATMPRYLSVGNEVNRWYEQYGMELDDPNGFQHFISLYEEIYDAAKVISPKTKIFCVFSREIVDENREADLEIFSYFNPEKLDLLVLTTYPFAVSSINQPSDIPDDYYTRVTSYFPGKPIGFSELSWSSMEAFGGETGQAEFLVQITSRLTLDHGIQLELLGWPWLHDLDVNDTSGLIHRDGTPKEALEVWKIIYSATTQ